MIGQYFEKFVKPHIWILGKFGTLGSIDPITLITLGSSAVHD